MKIFPTLTGRTFAYAFPPATRLIIIVVAVIISGTCCKMTVTQMSHMGNTGITLNSSSSYRALNT